MGGGLGERCLFHPPLPPQSGSKLPHSNGESTAVAIRLTLITRRDCHLCEEMAAVVEQVAPAAGAETEIRDVDADLDLRARYSDQVPVLLIDGRKAFKYRVTPSELRARLRAEARRARLRRWRARLSGGWST